MGTHSDWSELYNVPIPQPIDYGDAIHQITELGQAASASAETMFYARGCQQTYAGVNIPQYIISPVQEESLTLNTGQVQNRECLYELHSLFSTHTGNAMLYHPIPKDPTVLHPTLIFIKGTDFGLNWETQLDLDFFLNYATSNYYQGLIPEYMNHVNLIYAEILDYLVLYPNQKLIISGHSLGTRYSMDVYVKMFNEGYANNLQEVNLFNPYMFPGTPSFEMARNQAEVGTFYKY